MIEIEDYINLKKIERFLEQYIYDETTKNNGFTNLQIEEAKECLTNLIKIMSKL